MYNFIKKSLSKFVNQLVIVVFSKGKSEFVVFMVMKEHVTQCYGGLIAVFK